MSPPTATPNQRTIYYGRFICTPTPDELLIREGAVLVVGGSGSGVIEDVDWEVDNAEEARERFAKGGDGDLVMGVEHGFFFPGFIGMFVRNFVDCSMFHEPLLAWRCGSWRVYWKRRHGLRFPCGILVQLIPSHRFHFHSRDQLPQPTVPPDLPSNSQLQTPCHSLLS